MEMWRGSQQWVWLVPNNLVACWKAFSTELAFFKLFKLGKVESSSLPPLLFLGPTDRLLSEKFSPLLSRSSWARYVCFRASPAFLAEVIRVLGSALNEARCLEVRQAGQSPVLYVLVPESRL